jgi:hypothetical protein
LIGAFLVVLVVLARAHARAHVQEYIRRTRTKDHEPRAYEQTILTLQRGRI